jgi:hypothetical protein
MEASVNNTPARNTDQQKIDEISENFAPLFSAWNIPEPGPNQQATLVKALTAELPREHQRKRIQWLPLIRSQLSLFGMPFWWACAGVLAAIFLLSLIEGGRAVMMITLLASPLLAAIGVIYAFTNDSQAVTLLENISPIGPRTLFFIRSMLILAVNLFALPVILIPAQLIFPQMGFGRIIIEWLGVLMGIYGLAVYSSVRWQGAGGWLIPLGAWGLVIILAFQKSLLAGSPYLLTGLTLWAVQSNGALLTGLLMLVSGILFYAQAYRLVQNRPLWV